MAAEDAWWCFSSIWAGAWPGICIVIWFDLLVRASVTRAGTDMGSGASRHLLARPTRGNTITNHRNPSFKKATMPDGCPEAGAGFELERFAGQAKRLYSMFGVQKTPDRLPDPR